MAVQHWNNVGLEASSKVSVKDQRNLTEGEVVIEVDTSKQKKHRIKVTAFTSKTEAIKRNVLSTGPLLEQGCMGVHNKCNP